MKWEKRNDYCIESDTKHRIGRAMINGSWKYTLWKPGNSPYDADGYEMVGHFLDLDEAKKTANEISN